MESHYNHNCMTILVQQQTCNMPNAVKMLVVQDHTKTTLCVCLLDISMAKVSLHLSPKLFQQGQKDAIEKN